jgi:drug/metabolite transporter (DMT)-like permease
MVQKLQMAVGCPQSQVYATATPNSPIAGVGFNLYVKAMVKTFSSIPPACRAYFLLSMTAVCWGANAVFAKLAVGEVSPMILITLRWGGALLLLAVFANQYFRRDWKVLSRHLPFLLVMGIFGFTAFTALLYLSAHSTSALNIGILQGSIPALVLLGAFLFYRTPVSILQKTGVSMTFVGVLVVAFGGDVSQVLELTMNRGDLIILLACVFYAGYTIGLRKRPGTSSLGLFTGLAAAAFISGIPLAIIEVASGDYIWPSTKGWIVVALITLFPSFLAQIFFMQGVALIGPGRAGVFINLVPVFAAIFAVAYLGEQFEIFHGIALMLVLGGIWVSEKGKTD